MRIDNNKIYINRIMKIAAPIILSNDLVLFESISLNFIAKILLVVGGLEAVQGFSGIVKGILTNQAGMQALRQDDAGAALGNKAFSGTMGALKTAGKGTWGATKLAAKGAIYGTLGAGAVALGAAALGVGAGVLGVAGVGAGIYQGGKGIAKGINYLRHKYGENKDPGAGGSSKDAGAGGSSQDAGQSNMNSLGGPDGGADPTNLSGQDGGNMGGSDSGGPSGGGSLGDLSGGASGGAEPTNLSGQGGSTADAEAQKKEQQMQNLFGKDYKQQLQKEKNMQNLFGKDYKEYMKKKGLTQNNTNPPQNLSGK